MFAHHHRHPHPHHSASPVMHYQLQYPHHHPARSPVSNNINGLRSSSPAPPYYLDLGDEHGREIGQRRAAHALVRPGPAGCGVEAMHYHHPHHGHGHGHAHSHEHNRPSHNALAHRASSNSTLQDRLEAYARLDAQRRQEELEALQAQQQRRRAQEERAIRAKIQAQLEAEAQRQREAEAEAEAELARRAMRFAAMQKERAEAQARIRAAQLQAQAEAAQRRARFEYEQQQEKQQRIDSERKKAFLAQIMHQIHEQSVVAQEKHEAEQRKFVEHVQAQAAKRKLAIERMEREEEEARQQQEQVKFRQKQQAHFEAANDSDKAPTASKVNVEASSESKASKAEQKDEDQHIKPEELVKFLLAQFGILPPHQSPTSTSSANATAPASKPTPSPVVAEDKKGKGRAVSPTHLQATASKPQQEQEPEHDVAKSLAALEDIKNHFQGLSASFEEPETLIFESPAAPTASTSDNIGNSDSTTAAAPALAFTASNRPLKNYEESLTRLLTELDEVQSFGLQTVKDSRKALAVQVQQELDRVDAIKNKHWEMQQTRASEAVHVEFSAAAEASEAAKEVAVEANDKQEESLSNAAHTSVSEEAAKLDDDEAVQGYTVEDPSVTDNAASTIPAVASEDDTAPKPTVTETQLKEHLPTDSLVPAEDAPAANTKDTTANFSTLNTDAAADVNDEGAAVVVPARPPSPTTLSTEPLGTVENAETVPLSVDVQENAVDAIDQSAKQDDGETLVQEESANDGSETPATLAEEAETRIDTKSDAGSDTSSLKSGQKSPKATTVSDDDEDEDAEVHSETSFEWIE